jgi:hypothetical protein
LTFKDLSKKISSQTIIQEQQQTRSFDKLKNKPFWIWDIEQHKLEDIRTKGDCCFNHIISLPTKDGVEKPIFDYEKLLYDSLLGNDYSNILNHSFRHKHLFVKKSTGLGVTEFFFRLMAWLCLRNDDYRNSQMDTSTGMSHIYVYKFLYIAKLIFTINYFIYFTDCMSFSFLSR